VSICVCMYVYEKERERDPFEKCILFLFLSPPCISLQGEREKKREKKKKKNRRKKRVAVFLDIEGRECMHVEEEGMSGCVLSQCVCLNCIPIAVCVCMYVCVCVCVCV